jgi:O-antigen ligase
MVGRALLTIFIISYFVRLTSRFPVLGVIRLELFLGGLILVCVLLPSQPDKWRPGNNVSRHLHYFILYIFLSLPLVTWPGSVLRFHFDEWLKVSVFFIFIVALIRTVGQLKWIFGVFMGCQAIRILEPLYLHLTEGYWGSSAHSAVGGHFSILLRLSGAPHDVVNPNQLAWVIVNMVPFVFYLLWKGGLSGKILAILAVPPFLYCLLLTGSRSGLLSLVFVVLTMVYFSRNRVRNLAVVAVIALPVAFYSFGNLGSDMQTRYTSLVDNHVAGADTVQGRIDGIFRGIKTISNNPLFGNGLGTSRETNFNIIGGRAQITHNLYLEIFQETGLIGFILFMVFIIAIFKSLRETKQVLIAQGREESDWLFRLATATQVWIVMDLFYSLSCFGLRSWEWYLFGGVATTCLALAREKAGPELIAERSDTNSRVICLRSSFQLDESGKVI